MVGSKNHPTHRVHAGQGYQLRQQADRGIQRDRLPSKPTDSEKPNKFNREGACQP